MKKESNPEKGPVLPLFEYAKRYEDFATFDDFDHYFVYCLQTSGFKMHGIAQWMRLSDTALSIRMNLTDPEQPRFNSRHHHLYVINSGDPRPGQYLEWLAKQSLEHNQNVLMERLKRVLPHLEDLQMIRDVIEGKAK